MTNEYSFRFAFTPDLPGSSNMDLDRHLVCDVPEVPVVRFYTWAWPTISLGCNQDPAKRLRLDLCKQDGIEVVKRPTGGREILHGEDICYSVVWPFGAGRRVEEGKRIFEGINGILARALRKIGVRAYCRQVSGRGASRGPCFAQIDRGEIAVGERKLVASAQRIYSQVVLQQGSMLLRRPSTDITTYLKIDRPGAMRRNLEQTTTWLFDHVGEASSANSVVSQFEEEFERFFESAADNLSLESYGLMIDSPAIMKRQLRTVN